MGPKRKIDTSSIKYECARIRNIKPIKVTVVVNISNAFKKRIKPESNKVVSHMSKYTPPTQWYKHHEEVKKDICLRYEIKKLKNELISHEIQNKETMEQKSKEICAILLRFNSNDSCDKQQQGDEAFIQSLHKFGHECYPHTWNKTKALKLYNMLSDGRAFGSKEFITALQQQQMFLKLPD